MLNNVTFNMKDRAGCQFRPAEHRAAGAHSGRGRARVRSDSPPAGREGKLDGTMQITPVGPAVMGKA